MFVAWGGVGKTSLVADWLLGFVKHDWAGVDAFFDWSFYSQGTQDQSTANSGLFIDAALRHFGDRDIADSPAPADDKATRLAQRVAEQRTLLVLDGVEPLQHPSRPGQMEGRFKDPGIARLLKQLAQSTSMHGLCIVTTREPIVELTRFHGVTVCEHKLDHLQPHDAAALLHHAGAKFAGAKEIKPDDPELMAAATEVRSHALTLQLLGSYLRHTHGGDIRHRDRINWERAGEREQEGHTWVVMEAYEKWFEEHGEQGRQQIAVLRMLGLFDRPADIRCIDALRNRNSYFPDETTSARDDKRTVSSSLPREPIFELTDVLADLDDDQWQMTLSKLEERRLLTVVREGGRPTALDAHPLIREYFARQLRTERAEAWVRGHRRLYEHLTKTTEFQPETLAGLQPLYQAITHGCKAEMHDDALHAIYVSRVLRHTGAGGNFSTQKLGAISANLGAISSFFDRPWSKLSAHLSDIHREWVLNECAVLLCALGRLHEALESAHASYEICLQHKNWTEVAKRASNVSEIQRRLGEISMAMSTAEQAVMYANRGELQFFRTGTLASLAAVLHLAGRSEQSKQLFTEAEQMQMVNQSYYPRLYSVQGFSFCELLLQGVECAAWKETMMMGAAHRCIRDESKKPRHDNSPFIDLCEQVGERAGQTLGWATPLKMVREISLDRLTLAKTVLYRDLLRETQTTNIARVSNVHSELQEQITVSVSGLRQSGMMDLLPHGLLTRAWIRFLSGDQSGSRADLTEAEDIAERGSMSLHLADAHLYVARLFRDRVELESAERLLRELRQKGYKRRDEELADAIEAAQNW